MSDPPIDWPERREPAQGWLGGSAALASISFDVDAEAPLLAVDAAYAGHLSTMSHQAYGPRVGVPRILRLLERLGLRTTFFVPGATARRWPQAVRDILAAGHEVAAHSDRHVPLVKLTEREQREDLERCLDALGRLGAAPRGYRAPLWQQTAYTLALLADYGLDYDSSLMDDDRPYIAGKGRGVVELPVHWSLDDWEQYAFVPDPDIGQTIQTPGHVLELWTGELDAMRATGSLCLVCCHPFLTGRPARLRNVERFVEFARGVGDVEILACDEVASRARGASAAS